MSRPRILLAALALSAGGLVGIAVEEGYFGRAEIPTKNDRPTVGFGSTFREDGSPVRMGDTIDPVKALQRTAAHIAKSESGIKRCVTGALHQAEYDILVDFAYQYGVRKTCDSSVVRYINAGRYRDACDAYLLYRFSGGFDCSIPENRVCAGVWNRNVERKAKCIAAQ